jgi:hypothetical protein
MKFSVSIVAEGDREITLPEIVEFADAVAPLMGIASGVGSFWYGAQIVIDAEHSDLAADKAVEAFTDAAKTAKMPDWPITKIETVSEIEDFEDEFIGDDQK